MHLKVLNFRLTSFVPWKDEQHVKENVCSNQNAQGSFRRPIQWPCYLTRSCDLAVLDLVLCGCLKEKTYVGKSIQDLIYEIIKFIKCINLNYGSAPLNLEPSAAIWLAFLFCFCNTQLKLKMLKLNSAKVKQKQQDK